ncbi:MAG: uroporphyrinogen-III C-methyltransferase [Chitinophagaceae bacterium]|nr:uroporphyrinogen-III C-methyltransferase [Chitinophagaceae bacterium]
MKSTLYLVGGGPGDPDLITMKAVKILREAEVIIYDALANPTLLDYCSASAIKIFAGKRMGCHYLSQEEINQLIVDHGRMYTTVVRLKGGDPFVFGRAHEEMNAARSAGMKVEVIPGVSSSTAAPASQMIPLTCRGINESFWVTTGTTKSGDISPDIAHAAKSTATVVILMAMSRLEPIMDIFAAAGKEDTPVAIIQNATATNEKCVIGTVRDIVHRAAYEQMSNPAVIVVGEVVSLRTAFTSEHGHYVDITYDEAIKRRL